MNSRWVKAGLTLAVGIIILCLPVPDGLSVEAWRFLALYLATIAGIMLKPFSEPVVLLVAISISSIFMKNIGTVLSGYANTTTWLVFSAFMLSQAFIETGLGRRIAYILLRRFGRTTLGVGYVAAVTDLVLSPATPSITARTGGLVYPIFRSLAVTLDSEPGPTARRIGAYLTLLLYFISCTTAVLFITSLATNPLLVTFAKEILHLEITWFQWAQAAFLPGLIILFALPYLVYKMYPPEIKQINNIELSEKGLAELGPMKTKEKILAVLFILALIGWATGSITKINATAIAIAFITSCIVTGVVAWDSIAGAKSAWSTYIWYGGIIGMASGLGKYKVFTWLSDTIATNISFEGYSMLIVLSVLLFISVVLRYIFVALGSFVPSIIPVLFTIGMLAEVPPMLLVMMLGASCGFGSMITHYSTASGPVLFGVGYVDQATWWKIGTVLCIFSIIVYFVIGLPYWKFLGLW